MTEAQQMADTSFFEKIRQWVASHPNWTLTLLVVAALVPFLAKPFNFDDPLFIWAARQIQAHPADPYGFGVNWYGTAMPMWEVTKNPPLACYYLALVAGFLGWSEVSLHCAFLLPAAMVILGTCRLARHFCNRPILAASVTLFSPAFLISSTTVMCDVTMLALWVWSVTLWMEGLENNNHGRLAMAGGLIALAALTKYFGAGLIPLLLTYGLIKKRRLGGWSVMLLIPTLILAAYHIVTKIYYGQGLITDAGSYANAMREVYGFTGATTILTALAFTGGCIAGVIFFAPLLWRKKPLFLLVSAGVLVAISFLAEGSILKKYDSIAESDRLLFEAQIIFWAIGGICVLALVVGDVWVRRDPKAWLLALWVGGTFVFVTFCNWTINGRSILPMVPAVAVLLVRRLEQNAVAGWNTRLRNVSFCLGLSGVLTLLAAEADFRLAIAVRQSAQEVCVKYGDDQETLWFQGHWGFQYYMETWGGTSVDFKFSKLKPGDHMVWPWDNTNLLLLQPESVVLEEELITPIPGLLASMNRSSGAGFYTSLYGPLPFALGIPASEKISVFNLKSTSPPDSQKLFKPETNSPAQ